MRRAEVAIRGVWGTVLLLSPGPLLSTGKPASRSVLIAARVLGARQVIEAGLLARDGGREPPRWSIAVDGIHALTMVGLAAADPDVRGKALGSAAGAMFLAGLGGYGRSRANS